MIARFMSFCKPGVTQDAAAWRACSRPAEQGKKAAGALRAARGAAQGRWPAGKPAAAGKPWQRRWRPVSVGRGGRQTVGGLVCNYKKVQGAKCKLKFPTNLGLK